MNKNKVYYETRIVQGNQTLVLENPAQITFQCIGGSGIFYGQVQINNTYVLDSSEESFNSNKRPYELILNNNENEIDVSNYVIRFGGYLGTILRVIIKYYVN
jgi:hypothetical protein